MTIKRKTGTTPEGTPWSVKGVSPETREAVKRAARKSGKTMGEWIDEALRLAATDALKQEPQHPPPMKRLEDQLAEITARLDELQRPWWQRIIGKRP